MRYLLLIFLAVLTHADELQRIDSIVSDITNLKSKYEQEQTELQACKFKLLDEQQKNKILLKELDSYENLTKKEKEYEKSIENLKNQIKKLKEHLNLKENINIPQKTNAENVKNSLKNQIEKPKNQIKSNKIELIDTNPATYRMKKDTVVYDAIGGKELERWEKNRSFTSNYRTKEWIKITGYFVNKVWRAAGSDMWVKSSNVVKR